jgi:hypothetical protein
MRLIRLVNFPIGTNPNRDECQHDHRADGRADQPRTLVKPVPADEEAVRDLRRTVFSSQCQLIAGSLKQTFYCLIPTGERKP